MIRVIYIFVFAFVTSVVLNAYSRKVVVDKNSENKNIAAAINAANNGDTIIVKQGIYYESDLVITKSITIIGKNFPVVDANQKSEVFTIKADGVTIKGLIIKNAGVSFLKENSGVRIEASKNCMINGNKFINNFFAVYLSKSSDCTIINNFISAKGTSETNSGNGIHLWYSKNIRIEANEIIGQRDGIYLEFARNGIIRKNYSHNNLRYGLHFMFSDTCEYFQNIFENNGAGVAVMYSKFIAMSENNFINNWGPASFGLLLKDITDSNIKKNMFSKNSTGIYLEGCNRIDVSSNQFTNNGWAIKLMANSMDNYFTKNNFSGNSFDLSTNSRQNFNTFAGNYWSNYEGYDINKDGVGDVPYRPVKLFSMIVQQQPAALVLIRSMFINFLDITESIIPALIPETLVDLKPAMRRIN